MFTPLKNTSVYLRIQLRMHRYGTGISDYESWVSRVS